MKRQFAMAAFSALFLAFAALNGAQAATYTDVVLADNPNYYWNFNEDSGNANNLGSGAGGTLVAVTPSRAVNSHVTVGGFSLGNAAVLNGTNNSRFDGLTVAGNNLNDGAWSSYAIEFWMNASVGTNQYIMSNHANSPAVIYGYNPPNRMELFAGATRTGEAGPSVDTGSWHHVVIAYEDLLSGDQHSIYIDGGAVSLVDSTAVVNMVFQATGNFYLGGSDLDAFNGQLDEFALYNLTSFTGDDFDAKVASIVGHYSAAIPEPTSLVLTGLGMLGLLASRRRQLRG